MREIEKILDLRELPVEKTGVCAHYEGSIDKTGGNADWDWNLYPDENGEWVIFDVKGAGCICNFVQHRYLLSDEPTFRFYFDGEASPSFEIKPSEFGEKYPFLEPVAGKFISYPPMKRDDGRIDAIRVVRSFVPMPFCVSCKITSTVKLEGGGYHEGGWGHVVWHSYSEPKELEKFRADDPFYRKMIRQWGTPAANTLRQPDDIRRCSAFTLRAGEKRTVFSDDAPGLITALRCSTNSFRRSDLSGLILTASWDGSARPQLDAPFGCLFGNEVGHNPTAYSLAGVDTDGGYYAFYPMPYKKSAVIALENTGLRDVEIDAFSVTFTRACNAFYENNRFGYFSSSPYYPKTCTIGSDSIIAEIEGSGHIVSSVVSGYRTSDPASWASCEGDARIHFNGVRTPQIESDGSESYSCYGWGFPFPPQCNPASGYDGSVSPEDDRQQDWSMTRLLPGDYYPFRSGFRFGFESGDCNNIPMAHSGMVFYYSTGAASERLLFEIKPADEESERRSGFRMEGSKTARSLTSFFEGDDDDRAVTYSGYDPEQPCSFDVSLPSNADSLVLRRVSDQERPGQLAEVEVDGVRVEEYPWFFADRNPHKRWLEDEFVIPSAYIRGGKSVRIRLIPREFRGERNFNIFGLRVFAVSFGGR